MDDIITIIIIVTTNTIISIIIVIIIIIIINRSVFGPDFASCLRLPARKRDVWSCAQFFAGHGTSESAAPFPKGVKQIGAGNSSLPALCYVPQGCHRIASYLYVRGNNVSELVC